MRAEAEMRTQYVVERQVVQPTGPSTGVIVAQPGDVLPWAHATELGLVDEQSEAEHETDHYLSLTIRIPRWVGRWLGYDVLVCLVYVALSISG